MEVLHKQGFALLLLALIANSIPNPKCRRVLESLQPCFTPHLLFVGDCGPDSSRRYNHATSGGGIRQRSLSGPYMTTLRDHRLLLLHNYVRRSMK